MVTFPATVHERERWRWCFIFPYLETVYFVYTDMGCFGPMKCKQEADDFAAAMNGTL